MNQLFRNLLSLTFCLAVLILSPASSQAETKTAPIPVEVTDRSFQNTVLDATEPVLVYFWDSYCGYCARVTPWVNKAIPTFTGRMTIVKAKLNKVHRVSDRYKITGIPTFVIFKNGKAIAKSVGANQNEAALMEVFEDLLNEASKS